MTKMQVSKVVRVIGIDLHPRCFAAAAHIDMEESLWVHRRIELVDLDGWLEKNIKPTDILVLEASSNSFEFFKHISEFGAACVILESQRVGQVGNAYCKTDRIDATKIAKIYLSGLAKGVWVPDQHTRLRREILNKYQQANKSVTKHKNMIKSFLVEHGLVLPKSVTPYTVKGRIWVEDSYDWSPIQLQLIDLMYCDLNHALQSKETLTRIITLDVIEDDKVLGLTKLCGIGFITAFALAAAIGDIARFPSHKKLAAYLGLSPSVNQSGDNKRHGRIGKGGRKDTRSFIVQGAQSLLNSSDEYGGKFKKWGNSLAFKKGKNLAVAAVARKMAVSTWYHLKGFETNFDIPSKSIDTKIQKMSQKLGKEIIKSMGYENPREFKLKIKEKLIA